MLFILIAVSLFKEGTSGISHSSTSRVIITKNDVVCEKESLWIRCWWGNEEIRITDVFWGRKGDPYCGGVSKPECVKNLTSSRDYIENRCNKKEKCLIDATIGNLGDPCPAGQRTTNYLQVGYQCFPKHHRGRKHRSSEDKPKHKKRSRKSKKYKECRRFKKDVVSITAIPNSAMILACDHGISIHVKFAKYGKFMRHCKKRGVDRVRNTGSERMTIKEVYDRCEGRAHCSVPVDPKKFGDNSGIGDKSLQVAYRCVKTPVQLVDVKVNATATLKCYHGTKIFVHFAYKKCAAFVDEQCQGHRRCAVSGCRVEYACRKRKRFHRNGRGKYYTSGEDSKSVSDESDPKSESKSVSESKYKSSRAKTSSNGSSRYDSRSRDSIDSSEYCKKCKGHRHCRDKCRKRHRSERRLQPHSYPVVATHRTSVPNLGTQHVPTHGPKILRYKNE